MKHIIIIQGPTGSGKTDLAYKIAKELRTDIISADSRQIYRYANIGTNKEIFPDITTRLIDIKNPDEEYSAFAFKEDALKAINELENAGKIPVIVGGTAFYIDIITGRRRLNMVDEGYKKYLDEKESELQDKTTEYVQEKLKEADPHMYDSLNNSEIYNKQRIIKKIAYAIYYKENDPQVFDENILKDRQIYKIGISVPKDMLDKNIMIRTKNMMEKGLVDEVYSLVKEFGETPAILNTIGYREFLNYMHNTQDITPHLEEITERIYMDTIHYAKRQMTWLAKDPDITWYEKRDDLSIKVISEVIKKVYR